MILYRRITIVLLITACQQAVGQLSDTIQCSGDGTACYAIDGAFCGDSGICECLSFDFDYYNENNLWICNKDCTVKMPPCQNAGSCDTETLRCVCPSGYGGAFCERKEIADSCGLSNTVCSSDATCETDVCVCNTGYDGDGVICVDINECDSSPCSVNATCTNNPGSFECTCQSGFDGDGFICTDVDECITNPCSTNGECTNIPGSYTCSCLAGFTDDGLNTCVDINECDSSPCSVNAICTNNLGSFECTCPSGFDGDGFTCTDVDECTTNPCSVNEECTNTLGSYECSCVAGFNTGDGVNTCIDINECDSSPCSVNATCTNNPGSFECTCLSGFDGDGLICTDINECDSSPCSVNATCTNNPGSFECTCLSGFDGDGFICTDVDECITNPCNTNGECTNIPGSYTCSCLAGFTDDGVNTCIDINECDSSPCSVNATCTNNPGSFECTCLSGFDGDGFICTDVDECITNPCNTNGECTNIPGSYTCSCLAGFTDDGVNTCIDINECDSSPCSVNATCTNNPGSFECTCLSGFDGDGFICTDVDECITNPCNTNGECTNIPGSYTCSCLAGFTDDGVNTCIDINECDSSPCSVNATCTNNPGSFECTCLSGFDGDGFICTDVDECITNPCNTNGECTNIPGSYTCSCLAGFTDDGVNTCIDINECDSSPCSVNATCTNNPGSFECTCLSGFDGDGFICTDVNECGTNPCNTNGECTNTPGSYTCSCLAGFTGDGVNTCVDINECDSSPCSVNATCTNNPGSFECTCQSGFDGDGFICTDVDECITNPCSTNGECTNIPGSYTCSCLAGFTDDGLNTCVDIDECSSNMCSSNAVCLNSPGAFECTCEAGFYGDGVVCIAVDCGLPASFANGEIVLDDTGNTAFGATASVSCESGYGASVDTLTCTQSGIWDETPVCLAVDCGSNITTVTWGTASISSTTTVGSAASVTCSDGYENPSTETINCQTDGTWSTASCSIKDCGSDITTVTGGNASISSTTTVGSVASVKCNDGYENPSHETITCQTDGTWSTASCSIIDCGSNITTVAWGTASIASTTTVGSVASVTCNDGYENPSPETITCQTDGTWSTASCSTIDCGSNITTVTGGTASIASTTTVGSIAYVTCWDGYENPSVYDVFCEIDGTWSYAFCYPKDCGSDITTVTGGTASIASTTTVGSIAYVTCWDGYENPSVYDVFCEIDGTWSYAFCYPKDCGSDITTVTEGTASIASTTTVGSMAVVTCWDGYENLSGDDVFCEIDGTWSYVFCYPKDCGWIFLLNGEVSFTPDTLYESTALYTCDIGHVIAGTRNTTEAQGTCLENGTWSGIDITCVKKEPAFVLSMRRDIPFDVKLNDSNSVEYQSIKAETESKIDEIFVNSTLADIYKSSTVIQFSPGSVVIEAKLAFRSQLTTAGNEIVSIDPLLVANILKEGMSNTDPPFADPDTLTVAESINCGPFYPIAFEEVSISPDTYYGATATITCNTGFVITGTSQTSTTVTCTSTGVWSDTTVTCWRGDCGDLPIPDNGDIILLFSGYADMAFYTCHADFIVLGSTYTRTCLATGNWSDPVPICSEIGCYVLSGIEHGEVSYVAQKYGSQAIYTCDIGYTMDGVSVRICQNDTTWSGIPPVCREPNCGIPPLPLNGVFTFTADTLSGVMALYTCDSGHVIAGTRNTTEAQRTCLENGTWSGIDITCVKKEPAFVLSMRRDIPFDAKLNDPDSVEYQSLKAETESKIDESFVNSTLAEIYGSSTVIQFSPGSVVIEAKLEFRDQLTSAENEIASIDPLLVENILKEGVSNTDPPFADPDTLTVAESINCGPFYPSAFEEISISPDTYYGATATITCNTGLVITGTSQTSTTLTCTSTGVWSGNVTWSTCSWVVCGEPPIPDNGNVFRYYGFPLKEDIALYTCHQGYTISGSTDTRTCLAPGNWSDPAPICTEIDCGFIFLLNGEVSFTPDTLYEGTALYTCDSGHVIAGTRNTTEAQRTCLENGTWSGIDITCVKKDCGIPPLPLNGEVSFTPDTLYEATAQYTCDPGHVIAGTRNTTEEQRTCLENGTWSGIDITCVKKEPAFVLSMRRDIPFDAELNDPDSVEYQSLKEETESRIDESFVNSQLADIYGSSTVIQFSPGSVVIEAKLEFRDQLTTAENEIVSIDPLLVANILKEGVSNTDPPFADADSLTVAESINCGTLYPIYDEEISISPDTYYGDTATITCNTGFVITGTSKTSTTVTCTSSGLWSGNATWIRCSWVDCGELPIPNNGNVFPSVGYPLYSSIAFYTCHEGYNVSGSTDTRTCLAPGNWSDPVPMCTEIGCDVPSGIEHGEVSYVAQKYGSQAIYTCDIGYTMDGVSVRICQNDTTWSGIPPVCRIRTCDELEDIPNGQVFVDGRSEYGDIATYTCDDDYTLIGEPTRQCGDTGEWIGTPPTCQSTDTPVTTCNEIQDPTYNYTWGVQQTGQTSSKPCPDDFTGTVTKMCQEGGQWSDTNYACIRKAVKQVQNKVSALNENSTSEEIADTLGDLTSITNATTTNDTVDGDLTQAELETLTDSLDDLANVIDADTLTDTITEDFMDVTSNLIDEENADAWENSEKGAEKVLSAVDVFTNTLSEKLTASNETKTVITKKNIVVEVKKVTPNTDYVFPDSREASDYTNDWVNKTSSSVVLTSDNFQGTTNYITRASIYRDVSKILPTAQNNKSTAGNEGRHINGPVVALSIVPPIVGKLSKPVTLTFEHSENGSRQATCNFWVFLENGTGYWSTEGCTVVSSNDTITVCECDHLTNFAVLMSPWQAADANSLPLRIISIVGICVSILGLAITVFLHLFLWRYVRSDRVTIHMNLCIALAFSYAIFIGGVDRTESKESCAAVAAMLQYIYLVVFFVMLAEGIEIGSSVLFVFAKKSRVKILIILAWFIPAVIVGISLGVTKANGYGNEDFCWLSIDGGLIWAFVGPALAVILFNAVCLTLVFRAMFTTKAMAQKKKKEKIKTSVRSLCVLMPLMGVTWIIGIFHINNSFYWIQYMFAICNGLQGFFIFLIHCVFNEHIKRALATRERRKSSTTLTSSSTKKGLFSQLTKRASRDNRTSSNSFSQSREEPVSDTRKFSNLSNESREKAVSEGRGNSNSFSKTRDDRRVSNIISERREEAVTDGRRNSSLFAQSMDEPSRRVSNPHALTVKQNDRRHSSDFNPLGANKSYNDSNRRSGDLIFTSPLNQQNKGGLRRASSFSTKQLDIGLEGTTSSRVRHPKRFNFGDVDSLSRI